MFSQTLSKNILRITSIRDYCVKLIKNSQSKERLNQELPQPPSNNCQKTTATHSGLLPVYLCVCLHQRVPKVRPFLVFLVSLAFVNVLTRRIYSTNIFQMCADLVYLSQVKPNTSRVMVDTSENFFSPFLYFLLLQLKPQQGPSFLQLFLMEGKRNSREKCFHRTATQGLSFKAKPKQNHSKTYKL